MTARQTSGTLVSEARLNLRPTDLAGLTYISLPILKIMTLPGPKLDVSIASPSPFRLVTVRHILLTRPA